MKHVREPLPDVQTMRPEVSAALAAIVERATAKECRNRYADAAEMVEDLEQALAIEAARAGSTNGEATSVLQALPRETRAVAEPQLRRPRRLALWILIPVGLIAAGTAAYYVLRPEDGGDKAKPPVAAARPQPVKLIAAKDFDPPPGDGDEHANELRYALDRDPNTTWSTEGYDNGVFAQGKKGVGIYVDAPPPVAGRELVIRTPKVGWEGGIYVAKSGPPEDLGGWTQVADFTMTKKSQRIGLDTAGQRFRYYLVWITKLPPGAERAEISEILLYR
jgi:serine/threonine-protein kinase